MNEIVDTLNNEQREALSQIEGVILVVAGAGSGKTKLLTHRIAYMVKEKKIDPYNILAITFTNKAAKEMKERCEKLNIDCKNLWVSTFHSMCARILRQDIEKLGYYDKNFTIYSEQDVDKVYKDIFNKLNINKEEIKKNIVYHINNLKNNNLKIEDYINLYSYLPYIQDIKLVFESYQNELRKSNALDFNDLLIVTYNLLLKNEEILKKYQKRFKYILVDEFQDTNKIQYDLIKLLSSQSKNLFVVGDEDQCIYSWRGANYSNIQDLKNDFDDVKLYKLQRNYRSTKKILNLANQLIKNNKARTEKVLWTENEDGVQPEIRKLYDEKEEADTVAKEIYNLVNFKGYSYKDFAVLVRLNALTFPFEEKFLSYNISHKVYGGFKFYERAEIKNIISYLRIFINPKDDVALSRIINFPKRGIGDSAILKISENAKSNNKPWIDILINPEKYEITDSIRKKTNEFISVYLSLMSDYKNETLYQFVLNVIEKFKIKSAYNSGSEEDLNRILNIEIFLESVKEFEKNNKGSTLLDFLENITLISDIDTMEDSNDAVTIATIHSVKGLEFKYVFIVGLEEKIFPISRAYNNETDMEEERRLMYVAITRAKENLMLTYCQTRYLYGKREFQICSRFLKELKIETNYQENMSKSINSISKSNFIYEKVNEEKVNSKYSYNPFEKAQKTKYQKYIEENNIKKDEFNIGDKVLHPKFGIGQVKNIDSQFIEIDFDKLGIKTLLLTIAPLKKI